MQLSRRAFLFLTGGASAAVAAEPTRQMVNRLIPYVTPPEKILPGTWGAFASTCRECPAGCGMHLWHRDGRITKAEGTPGHPLNQGALCARGQSSLQGVYDPDRLRQVLRRDQNGHLQPASWDLALNQIAERLTAAETRLVFLTDLQTGALAELMERFTTAFDAPPPLKYEPYNYEALREAHRILFDRPAIPVYHLAECDFILSFSCDFLETWLSPVEFAQGFARMHALQENRIGRFAYVGPRLSMTAGSADDFLHVPPGAERFVALAMVRVMLDQGWVKGPAEAIERQVAALGGDRARAQAGLPDKKLVALARAFSQAEASVAMAGPEGSADPVARDTALAVALLNLAAGRIGQTVDFSRTHALSQTATHQELDSLLASLGPRDLLFIHGSNPAFTRPSSRPHLERAGAVVHLTTLPNETSELADWVLPLDAPAETWGDYAPYEGIEGLLQPTMARLYETHNAGDILLELARLAERPLARAGTSRPPADFRAWLEARWQDLHGKVRENRPFKKFWEDALRGGGIWQDAPKVRVALTGSPRFEPFSPTAAPQKNDLALRLFPSIFFFDGRTANRGWLQEAPDPMSTVTWGSWLDLHPQTARELGVRQQDVVALKTPAGTIDVPVRLSEDIVPGAAAIPLGQGHTARHLSVARGVGCNPFALLGPSGMPPLVSLEKTGRSERLVALSATQEQHGREILRSVTLAEVRSGHPGKPEEPIMPLPEGYQKDRDVFPPHEHRKHRWAMVVDLQRCIGCGACAVACYAENNIAVVGRQNAADGLEMAWLKAVPYRAEESRMRVSWLPLLCQHCDAAPCEPVCPVFAAVHNEEGLNAQVYNRCIGTRYCSNNCPYKVRRFNWINPTWKQPLELQLNPEVTVRCRGVMEKCTFCVQRIRQAQYRAMRENRPLQDGEITPACQQTCPAGVFTFGDLLDPESKVSRLFRHDPRRYQVLRELNTKPAVVYLHKVRLEELA